MSYQSRLQSLREQMREQGLKAYLVVTGDPHDSEEPAPYFASERRFFCPFTGDNAYLLVTEQDSYLWTDGRFFISAEAELKDSGTVLMKMGTPGYPTLFEKIKADALSPLGTNFSLISPAFLDELRAAAKVVEDKDLSYLVENRPAFPSSKVWRYDDPKYNALSREEKIEKVLAKCRELGAEANLVTTLDDIAWILNLRANDIACTPLFYSYLYLSASEGNHLFIDPSRIDFPLPGIEIHPYEEVASFLKQKENVATLADRNKCNAELYDLLKKPINARIPSNLMKAIKSDVEIKNIKEIQAIDGVALLKLIAYLDEHNDGSLDEWGVAEKLAGFRREGERFLDESFTTIAAYGPNAAMMHYAPTKDVYSKLDGSGIELLVDSGGQYLGGTTDTTRTFCLGKPSEEYIHDYTLTLKSVIALTTSIFLDGASGLTLDMKAREIMWKEGLDYKCGTGHGVGYLSVVHEGPNGFRYRTASGKDDGAKNVPGMVTTVEPGVYKEGKYGIRIENNILTVPAFTVGTDQFYRFETITYVPIETKALDLSLLSDEEIKWLNDYHKEVYEHLAPLVSGKLLEVLKEKTAPIAR